MGISVAIGVLIYNTARSQYKKAFSGTNTPSIQTQDTPKTGFKYILSAPERFFQKLTHFPDITSPFYSSMNDQDLTWEEKQKTFEKTFSPLVEYWCSIAGAVTITFMLIFALFNRIDLLWIVLPVWIFGVLVILVIIQRQTIKKFNSKFQERSAPLAITAN